MIGALLCVQHRMHKPFVRLAMFVLYTVEDEVTLYS